MRNRQGHAQIRPQKPELLTLNFVVAPRDANTASSGQSGGRGYWILGLHGKREEGIFSVSPIDDETSFLSHNQSWKKAAPLPRRATKTLPLTIWILRPQYGITWIGNVPWCILFRWYISMSGSLT